MSVATPRLLERTDELARLDGLLEMIAGGTGAIAAVEGPPGVGKSSLLTAAKELASHRGVQVRAAAANEMQQATPFGVVGDLLAVDVSHGAGGETRGFALLERLTDQLVALAERQPLMLVIDDLHQADDASARLLVFLARRLEDVPLLLLVALRPAETTELTARLLTQPLVQLLQPAPLGAGAVAEMVAEAMGSDADPEFAAACHRATGGNPFLLRELMRSLTKAEVAPRAASAPLLGALGPEALTQGLARRLGALSSGARGLARAVAVLGADAHLRHAAALAGLTMEEALDALDVLVAADVLSDERPPAFTHPLVRAAVEAGIPSGRRARWHAAAARRLADEGAGADRIATHLAETEPAGEEWVAEVLRAAAASSKKLGAPEIAARHLRRAVAEPPPAGVRHALLCELAQAEAESGVLTGAREALTAALEAAATDDERLTAAVLLHNFSEEAEATAELLDPLIARFAGERPQAAVLLEALAVVRGLMSAPVEAGMQARVRRFRETAPTDPAISEPAVLAVAAQTRVFANEPAVDAAVLAEAAVARLGDGHPAARPAIFFHGVNALIYTERFELAQSVLDDLVVTSRRQGSIPEHNAARAFRARLHFRTGALDAAEEDAREGLEAAELFAPSMNLTQIVAMLIEVQRERGDLEGAERVLVDTDLHTREFATIQFAHLVHARGRLRVAQGRIDEGLRDLLACGSRYETPVMRAPTVRCWRSDAALAMLGTRPNEARRLADEEVALSRRFGTPRALGIALRAASLVRGGEEGLVLLEEAATVLASSGARLEHARALIDLGAARRRAGQRVEGRPPLREGLDAAHRCGSRILVDQARLELRASGARPRRDMISGRDALTPAEERVAALASRGMTNREIAQALFLSMKTVENHLARIYGKLGISSRDALAGIVEAGSPEN